MMNNKKLANQMYYHFKVLKYWNDMYNLGTPVVNDIQYDKLYLKTYRLFSENGLKFNIDSKVFIVPSSIKVRHKKPMLSLNKTTSYSGIKKHFAKYPGNSYILQPKYDGISISLVYEQGRLKYILTRGDGQYGDDITNKIFNIYNIPKVIKEKEDITIYGELVVNKKTLKVNAINSHRGLIMHVIRSQEPINIMLFFIAYDLIGIKYQSVENCLNILKRLEFVHAKFWKMNTLANIEDIKKQITNLDFFTDGIVFKINEYSLMEEYGQNNKYPLGQIAYKFLIMSALSTVLYIRWSYGPAGRYTPILMIKPVEIDNSIIRKISFFNAMNLYQAKIRPGTKIIVEKSGQIIPHVRRIIKHTKPWRMEVINKCRYCGTRTEMLIDSFRCPNPLCPEKLIKNSIKHVSKSVLNIKNLNESSIRKLFSALNINHIIELFGFSKEEIINVKVDGLLQKSLERIWDGIDQARNIKNEVLPLLLNIISIGNAGTKNFMKEFGDLFSFYRYFYNEIHTKNNLNLTKKRLIWMKGQLLENKSLEIIRKLYKLQRNGYINIIKSNNNIGLKKCVITGTLSAPRHVIIEEIKDTFVVVTRITKGVLFLIAGDKPSTDKVKEAEKRKLEIFTEVEFRKKFNF